MDLARLHQSLGCSDECIRNGVRLFRSSMANEGLHDEHMKSLVGGSVRWPCEAMSGLYEFDKMGAFGDQRERLTELHFKKATQGPEQSLALVERLAGRLQNSGVKLLHDCAENILFAGKVVVKRAT